MIYNWLTICWPFLAILKQFLSPENDVPRVTPRSCGGLSAAPAGWLSDGHHHLTTLCTARETQDDTFGVFGCFWFNFLDEYVVMEKKKTAWNMQRQLFFWIRCFLDYFDGERTDVSPCKNRFDLMDKTRNMRNMHSMTLVLASSWIDITGCKTQQLTQSNHPFFSQ